MYNLDVLNPAKSTYERLLVIPGGGIDKYVPSFGKELEDTERYLNNLLDGTYSGGSND